MPHYDYKCSDCGYQFEIFQSMTEDKLTTCPECGGHLERLIGPGAGMLFKGSGFYITDYRSESYRKGKQSAEAKPTPGGAKDASKNKPTPAGTGAEKKAGDKSGEGKK